MTSIVTEENLVRIPEAVASELGIGPGTKLDWQPTGSGDTLMVKVLPNHAALAASLQGAGRKYLKPGEDPVRDLLEEREREETEREALL